MSDEFGPFRVGEVVLLTGWCEPLNKRAGDEVTIASEYRLFTNTYSYDKFCASAGWLLQERCVMPGRWLGNQVLAMHGEVRRKPRPALDLSFLEDVDWRAEEA